MSEPEPHDVAPELPELSRRTMRALGLAMVASLVLWQFSYGAFLLYPFKIIATWIHELSHGIVMLLSGAGFDRMEVYRDGSGLSFAAGATDRLRRALIAPAGYMGTPLFGAALLVFGQSVRGARWALGGVGAALALSALFVVANPFGQTVLAVTGVVLLVLGVVAPARWAIAGAMLLAVQMCVNAVLDIRVLFRPVMVVDGKIAGGSDASNMAESTFGAVGSWGVWFWATVWLVWSLALLYGAIRISEARRSRRAAAGDPSRAAPRGGSDCSDPSRSPG
jgi:hypothetical protein